MTLKPGTIEESTIPDPLGDRISELDKQIADAERFAAGKGDVYAELAKAGPWAIQEAQKRGPQMRKAIETARIQRNMLQQQQELYQRIQRAESAINKPGVSVDTQSLANAKAAYEQNKPVIEALTSKELSPFVNLDNKGNVRIDVRTAVNSGVSKELLKNAGVSGATQEIVRIKIRKGKEALQKYGYKTRPPAVFMLNAEVIRQGYGIAYIVLNLLI